MLTMPVVRLRILPALLVGVVLINGRFLRADEPESQPAQYELDDFVISAASADEPARPTFSLPEALAYLERGALAWTKKRDCVSCHTNGSYMLVRPALTPFVGKPSETMRHFFVETIEKFRDRDHEKNLAGVRPTQMAYVAAGLAEWDARVTGKLSAETDAALRLMFKLQSEEGSWGNADCWPPLESSVYHGTCVASMAVAAAPNWLNELEDAELLVSVDKMKTYLRTVSPPHDYARVLLLWASARLPGLLEEGRQPELIETVFSHQRSDGGWSIRTFAAPEAWGRGNRAEKLREEPNFADPDSDGHQTGLAVVVLREAGVPADDPRIRRAVAWLLANQRESGRWWTRSLNTDKYHFITYSGTCYPLLALAKCGALPEQQADNKAP